MYSVHMIFMYLMFTEWCGPPLHNMVWESQGLGTCFLYYYYFDFKNVNLNIDVNNPVVSLIIDYAYAGMFWILKVLATIPYFNFHFFPHLLIFLQFRDPSY